MYSLHTVPQSLRFREYQNYRYPLVSLVLIKCSGITDSIQSQHNKYECPQCRTIFNDVLKASGTDIKYIQSVDPLRDVVFLLAILCSQLECCTCHQTVSVVDAFDGKHQCLKQDPPSPSVFQTVESGEKPFQCSLCQKYYKTATSLASHISASHSGEHTCTRCQPPVILNSAKALATHNQIHHSGERTCTRCQPPVILNSAKALATHNQIHHSGERTCTRCQPPVILNSAKALANHKFRKHRKRNNSSGPGSSQPQIKKIRLDDNSEVVIVYLSEFKMPDLTAGNYR